MEDMYHSEIEMKNQQGKTYIGASFGPLISLISEIISDSSHVLIYQDRKLYKECTEKRGLFGKIEFYSIY
jgi:hypothetical protein